MNVNQTGHSIQTPTTGFSIQVANWCDLLSLTPATTLASGTVIFPQAPQHDQEFKLVSTQIITALTSTAGTSQTIQNAPTTLAANVPISWRYDAPTMTWILTRNVTPPILSGTPGTGVTAVEYISGYYHTTVLTVNTVLPNIPGGASLGVGVLMYTLPAGAQIIEASYFSMGITQTTGHINANTPNVGLGTVIASGAVSVLSGTATFQDISVGVNAANCTGTATVQTALATASPFVVIRAAGSAKTVFFNAAAAWAASGDPAAVLAGTIVLQWATMA